MKFDKDAYMAPQIGNIGKYAMVVGIIGLVFSLAGYFIDSKQFFHSYLVAFMFWTSIGLGGLFFVMINHLTSATWSVVLRRIVENIMYGLPFMAILAIPILIGLGDLYHWSHTEVVASDQLLEGKSPFLNTPFFVIRMIGYFVIWFLLTRLLYKTSIDQDNGAGSGHITRMRRISAPGMILFAFSLTFASFDWLMSLDAHWFSTIYGVYVFAGSVVAVLAFLIIIVMYLKRKNVLSVEITPEHYHDLGKLTFAFIIFWGYMAFSQYFLIWYGNIPEETVWFLHRWEGSWKVITLLLVFGHFSLPFFVLFPRGTKRNPTALTVMAIWVLVMHWIDLYWLVMPSLHHESVHLSWMDPVTMIGVGGIFVWIFWRKLVSQPLVPINDPGLERSMRFVNH